ncbi:Mannose-1-phosphate guanylyltransferase [Thalassoporum mexicanum PCC 7367]|uniref:sugar phosphate nucleotidyltransferase n=1 Tax=Thalassoporum mexicanum TaxID=3457544 RepID=UPI00029FCAB7|nr:NDP-sugar synthase [Pseudanabaena sp. PCC 7367]AFY68677.1 Mannose-1-phosphate guanylyltransferase [Pseudanabaena sp. PCC 7367]
MQAVIIAGGKGTRLRPLTYGTPKPMLPIFDQPFLAWMVDRCCQAGVTDILINVRYQAHQVRDYFGNGERFGVKIRYVEESTPLDTAGAMKLAQPYFTGESLLVFNADILTNLDLKSMIRFHKDSKADATLALKRVEDIRPFGLVEIDPDDRVLAFREKPAADQAEVFLAKGINTINAGTYILEPEIFNDYPDGEPLSFERQVFPNVLAAGKKMVGYAWDGYWMDLGTPQKYYQAHLDILAGAMPYAIANATSSSAGIWIGQEAEIDAAAKLEAPCYVGDRARITANAHVPANTVVGANTLVDRAITPGIYAPGSMLI